MENDSSEFDQPNIFTEMAALLIPTIITETLARIPKMEDFSRMNIDKLREQLLVEVIAEMSGHSSSDLKSSSLSSLVSSNPTFHNGSKSQESVATPITALSHNGSDESMLQSEAPLYTLRITLDRLYTEYYQCMKQDIMKELQCEIRELIREEREKSHIVTNAHLTDSTKTESDDSNGLTLSQIIRSYTLNNEVADVSISLNQSAESQSSSNLMKSTDSMQTSSRSGSAIVRVLSEINRGNSHSHVQLTRVKSADIVLEDKFPTHQQPPVSAVSLVKTPVAKRPLSKSPPTPPIPRKQN